MNNNLLVILTIFFISLLNGYSQSISIKEKSEDIIIKNDTSFVKHITVLLKKDSRIINYPIFYDAELEQVSNIKIYTKRGKRFRLLKNNIIKEEDVELEYIASKKVKSIIIPPEVETKITYSVNCKELMYLSDLRFFSSDEIDTLKYQITAPSQFHLAHNTIHRDSLEYLKIDSTHTDSFKKWTIKVKPVKVTPDPLALFGIYKNLKEPLMRIIITPISYKNNEKNYMNHWYLQQLSKRKGLDDNAIRKINEITNGITDSKLIIEALYNYVRSNFKYVAIEIGMGAFIPSHVNEVFINKQGDCKDLSNFLSEALIYKGIESNLALAATSDHISDCDFPSLSSANHVVCLAYINEKPIILDPTDPIHTIQMPVESIQKRSILIVKPSGGEYYIAPSFSTSQNLIDYKIKLRLDKDKKMEGNFNSSYKGISGNFLKRELLYANIDQKNSIGKKHYTSIFRKQSVKDVKIKSTKEVVIAEGKISIKGKVFNNGNEKLLFIDFLPRIIETIDRETLLEGMNLENSFSKNVNLKIILDEPIQTFDTIEHRFDNQGVSLVLLISNPSESLIECNYKAQINNTVMETENLKAVNYILKSFKKIANEPIVFKNKT